MTVPELARFPAIGLPVSPAAGAGGGTPRTPALRSQEPESETVSAGFTCLKMHHQKQLNDRKQFILVPLIVLFSIHYHSLTFPPLFAAK